MSTGVVFVGGPYDGERRTVEGDVPALYLRVHFAPSLVVPDDLATVLDPIALAHGDYRFDDASRTYVWLGDPA